MSKMFSRESPKFQTGCQVSKRSPGHSKDIIMGNNIDLEIYSVLQCVAVCCSVLQCVAVDPTCK